ncbi:hypothetical protein BDF20DRAFT_659648 [Mycotypha africana]|uniref:uncharacterized protein n=1 Tax=Mycotypha africana TaxID=64632 RepID=UPI0023000CA2|nr:uncharacterized protein BDF20DRAFT_659648 [Mycotypha africana]KAI8973569.1 hypothetical protein BDF20DRAFT_659648 [Mycotypha africana]
MDWSCSVCGDIMKDILSDKPDMSTTVDSIANKGEEIPSFELSFKPENSSSSTPSTTVLNNGTKSGALENDNYKEADGTYEQSQNRPQNVSQKDQVEDDKVSKLRSLPSTEASPVTINSSINTVCDNRNTSLIRPPIWLDALIALLLSIVLGLLIHKSLT